MTKNKFLKITCPRCTKKQFVFSKSSTKVKCSNCNLLLVRTTGGKTQIKAPVKEVLWR